MKDNDLHFRFDRKKADKLIIILIAARNVLKDVSVCDEEYEFCNVLLDVIEKYRRERNKCV